MMLCILFFLTFINSENGFIITHGHRYGLFRQPYYYHHHHHPLHHQHYYHGFNQPFNHIRYLLHRNCTCEGGCYSCQYKRVPYYFGCGMFKMECEKGKGNGTNNTTEGPEGKGARKLNPVQLSIDEPTKKFDTTTPTSENVSDEDYDSDAREDTIKSKEIKIIASSSTTESTVSTSTESTVSTTPTTLITSSASSINATAQSTEKSTVTTVATSSTTYVMEKQRRSNL